MADIKVNDIFEELVDENTKLNDCLNVLIRFKTFIDTIIAKLKTSLESNESQMFDDFQKEVEDVFTRNKLDFSVKDHNQRKTQIFEFLSSKPKSSQPSKQWPPKPSSKRRKNGLKPGVRPKIRPKIREQVINFNDIEVDEHKRYVCSFIGCGQRLKSKETLRAHLRLHSSNPKPHQCDFVECGFSTAKRSELKDHINAHKGIKPFGCNFCDKQFSAERYLKTHVDIKHKVTDQILVCELDDCFKEFRTELSLKNHQRFHLMEKRFVCDETNCSFRTIHASLLKQHRFKVHSDERPFHCEVIGCDKAFKDNSDRNKHMLSHTSDFNFKCLFDGCNKAFKSAQTLRKHSVIHTDIELACDWPGCEYTTKMRKCLLSHQGIHSSERNFICNWPECGKRFKNKIRLQTHHRIHISDKRYACSWPGCQYRCTDSGNLIKHRRVHIKN